MPDLLLEIGCEELPSSFVAGALAALPGAITERLTASRIAHGAARPLGSPRRIAVLIDQLASSQRDVEEELTGPPAAAAFDKDGKPTKGAEAFAKKLGVPVEALRVVETAKGKYVAGTRKESGRPTIELLPKLLVEAIAAIPFRKSMRWGAGEVAFGRPIHWIVALLDRQVVSLQFADIASGRTTRGHRFLAPSAIELGIPSEYQAKLAEAHVVVDVPERKQRMLTRLTARAIELGGVLQEDAFLADENTGLVEEPLVVDGSFDEAFLALPDRLIVDVMRTHQRYFSIRNSTGALMPRYLAVVNTANSPATIRKGNDTAIRARLSDARFFVQSDLTTGLAQYAQKLAGIRYHAKLGSVADKVARMQAFGTALVARLGGAPELSAQVERATAICKADLASLTVGEFPEMQGHAGRAIALASGESPEVAEAIAQHWLEEFTDLGALGVLLGLADRLDHLVGGFSVGLAPTGANDPFSMRRSFNRAINAYLLGVDRGLRLPPLSELAKTAYDAYGSGQTRLQKTWLELQPELTAFMRARLIGLFDEAIEVSANSPAIVSFRAPRDVVEACIDAGFDDLSDLRARISAIRDARGTPAFARLATALKRASKITKEIEPREPDASRFDHPAERALWSAYAAARDVITSATERGDYRTAVEATSSAIAEPMDDFFDKDKGVYVMHDDPLVRDNRLAMLATIAGVLRKVALIDALEI